jgi:hypothetical protein
MQTSESIKAISAALVAFHKEVGKIKKDAKNPFFKSTYASLSGILDAIDEPLVNNGLSIVQFPEGEHQLTTRLVHSSGEWMEATYTMHPVKQSPQDLGSAITYQRRYAVGAVLSLNIDDDDDANVASGKSQQSAGNGQNNSQPKDDKPWLNENTKEFNGAIAKLQKGETSIEKIEKVFKLSKSIKEKLQAAIPANA